MHNISCLLSWKALLIYNYMAEAFYFSNKYFGFIFTEYGIHFQLGKLTTIDRDDDASSVTNNIYKYQREFNL